MENKRKSILVSKFMEVSEIPEGLEDHGWKVFIDGELISDVHMVIMESSRGRVILGFRVKDGFVSPLYEEEGGVIILLISKTEDGTELVGGINEIRYNMDGEGKPVLCALGGLRLQDEDLCSTVKGKIHTKVPGLSTKGISRYAEFMELTTDRLYKVADPHVEGRGAISSFELFIPFEQLEKSTDGSYGLIGTNGNVQFSPISEAAGKSGDALFNALLAFRFTRLVKQGIYVAVQK